MVIHVLLIRKLFIYGEVGLIGQTHYAIYYSHIIRINICGKKLKQMVIDHMAEMAIRRL